MVTESLKLEHQEKYYNQLVMETIKKFDSVKMMREIREKLSDKYWKHPDILKKEMEEIRKKYSLNIANPKAN